MAQQGSLGPPAQPERPPPPEGMLPDAAELWRFVVAAMPAGWLRREYFDLLAMYCGHLLEWRRCNAEAERVWEQAKDGQGVDMGTLEDWQRMRDREARRAADLATKLRLTPQAVMERNIPARGASAPPPWSK